MSDSFLSKERVESSASKLAPSPSALFTAPSLDMLGFLSIFSVKCKKYMYYVRSYNYKWRQNICKKSTSPAQRKNPRNGFYEIFYSHSSHSNTESIQTMHVLRNCGWRDRGTIFVNVYFLSLGEQIKTFNRAPIQAPSSGSTACTFVRFVTFCLSPTLQI